MPIDYQDATLATVLRNRRSVRGFTPQAIEPELLRSIFAEAQLSPSNCNTQPWQTYVASGDSCNQLRQGLVEQIMAGTPPKAEFEYFSKFKGQHRTRQVECAEALYGAMGIPREDKRGRMGALVRNYQFFDAPHVAFICMDKEFDIVNGLDIGVYLQTLMLIMEANGVASCAQGALAYFPPLVKEVLGIPEQEGILVGVSFGYEDTQVAANNARTNRAPIEQCVVFKD
ncbi:nitroreductase [Ferrimonas lipolytica]|uniref:Nitroreductase n=1 Tax=Ferrimonas lipolytica TaxID=2724191 RepID=A0A6H1UD17_9GAMM|nr:nitroreductase [Ferrimonas lipolytica]QIZ76934.1 nitroreductase [Ferrimonas lipolytica]